MKTIAVGTKKAQDVTWYPELSDERKCESAQYRK